MLKYLNFYENAFIFMLGKTALTFKQYYTHLKPISVFVLTSPEASWSKIKEHTYFRLFQHLHIIYKMLKN